MLGFGRVRELEEELHRTEQKLEECREILRDANDLQAHEKDYFLRVTDERARFAKGLAKVAGHVRKGKDAFDKSQDKARNLLAQMREKSSQWKEADAPLPQEKNPEEPPEAGKQELQDLSEERKRLEETVLSAASLAEEVAAFFRALDVQALSLAIEAGRLGEEAERFVHAAEDIRSSAEGAAAKMDDLRSKMDEMMDHADRTKEQTAQAEEAIRQTASLWKKREDQIRAATTQSLREARQRGREYDRVLAGLDQVVQAGDRAISSQESALSQLETLSDGFLEEQRSAEEAQAFFEKVIGA